MRIIRPRPANPGGGPRIRLGEEGWTEQELMDRWRKSQPTDETLAPFTVEQYRSGLLSEMQRNYIQAATQDSADAYLESIRASPAPAAGMEITGAQIAALKAQRARWLSWKASGSLPPSISPGAPSTAPSVFDYPRLPTASDVASAPTEREAKALASEVVKNAAKGPPLWFDCRESAFQRIHGAWEPFKYEYYPMLTAFRIGCYGRVAGAVIGVALLIWLLDASLPR